ncbi:MAG: ABC-2 family transporter protein [Pirellulaceae bacterium]
MTATHPSYWRVLCTFARNSLVRDMTFRVNFLIQCISSVSWSAMNYGFFEIVFSYTGSIGADSGWGKYEYFVFLATTWLINSLIQTFCMPNAQEFSELIRTGNLDFALLKPIDTQFLISFQKVEWSSLTNGFMGIGVLIYSLSQLASRSPTPLVLSPLTIVLYIFYLGCGAAILYSVMISLAATSIWLGRNQSLYNFWFYITNFSRYPMEIYARSWGLPLFVLFTFVIPVLVVVNVPARLLADPLQSQDTWKWPLAGFALFATGMSLFVSRLIFKAALRSYRSASS